MYPPPRGQRRLLRSWIPLCGLLSAFFLISCSTRHPVTTLLPFESVFAPVGKVELKITPVVALSVTRNSRGFFYVADYRKRIVEKFNPDGRQVGTVGKRGERPGHFSLPFALACGIDDDLYVLDINQSRVHIFGPSGALKSSFTFSGLGFTGIALAVDQMGDVYVGGFNHLLPPSQRFILHKFDSRGNYVSSLFPLNPRVDDLNLEVVGGVEMAVGQNGSLFAAQPVGPYFYKFTSDGHLSATLGHVPAFYQKPIAMPKKLPTNKPKEESLVTKLLARWTQLTQITVMPDGHILITYRIHSPREYAIDIYDSLGHLLRGGVASDFLPLFSDGSGTIYFQPAPPMAQKGFLTLSKFRLRAQKGDT